jgi:1-acyl-sn-glycerol-3-phosphate acyltransferase
MTTETKPKTQRTRQRRRRGFVEAQSPFWFRFAAVLVGWLLRFWIRRFAAQHAGRMPDSGGVFLIANHTSGLDPFLVAYPVRRRVPRGPGKVEIFESPFFAFIMRKIGIFPLRQGETDAGAVRAMIELYRAGKVVIVFPEGGRSETGEMHAFNPDFARLAIRLRSRLLPAGIVGARDALPIGHYIPRPNTRVAVLYGHPFELDQFYDRELTAEVAQEASEILYAKVAEQLTAARRLQEEL